MKHHFRHFFFLCLLTLSCASLTAQPAPSINSTNLGNESAGNAGALGGERPENAETVITSQEEARFDNRSGVAEFIGSVVVTDPQFTMTCKRLKAFLNEDRKGLERVEAEGEVVIRQENQDEGGGQVVSVARSGKAIFYPATGDVELLDWPQVVQGINAHVGTEVSTKMVLNRAGRINTDGASKTVIVDTGEGAR